MKKDSLDLPHPASVLHAASLLLKEFDPTKMVYLDPWGNWKENPQNSIQWSVNEILFHLWRMKKKNRDDALKTIIKVFATEPQWTLMLKMRTALIKKSSAPIINSTKEELIQKIISEFKSSQRPQIVHPFLIILQVLAWEMKYESLNQNMDTFVPEWDLEEKKKLQKYKIKFRDSDKLLKNCLSKQETHLLKQTFHELKNTFPQWIGLIPDLIAEEQKLMDDLHELLKQAKHEAIKEESCDQIREKIFPSTGVVSDISPALLRPCIHLLNNKNIDVSSGIPYRASVILSILQDSRSTKALLKALKELPLHFTNIRENIIYTLGNLKENKAVHPIKKVLEGPDKQVQSHLNGTKKPSLLEGQKEEALRSLGKIGLEALKTLPSLVKYQHHTSSKIKTHLSWTLGEIGKTQKEKHGGVSADILISLLTLLKSRNKLVFEEAVSALRKISMPEFLHTLYLYDVGAVNILGLKPAQRGLYELSETLHYLIHSQGRAILAVNGDSGTGKTYFCESILESFGDLEPKEILYLMRDRKRDQKILNQILGIQWLKKYIDPIHYQDYPHSEKDDHPQEFLTKFLEENSDKKLIILDGCRDRYYFQSIIDLLYFNQKLDVVVNFRADYSTRRKNLEEREIALESIKTHLSFLEEPPLEDTHFYQEGKAIVYDLDNSINRRLNKPEIQELFKKQRIGTWGNMIKVGKFSQKTKTLSVKKEPVSYSENSFDLEKSDFLRQKKWDFKPEEKRFKPFLNENIEDNPHLLQTIQVGELRPLRIHFYAQNQIAGIGEKGKVFILTFLDNRIFHSSLEEFKAFTLLGRNLFLVNQKGELMSVSFEKGSIIKYENLSSPVYSLTSLPRNKLITGHKNGFILVWDMENSEILKFKAHSSPVRSLAVNYSGNIYSWGMDQKLKHWNLQTGKVQEIETKKDTLSYLNIYSQTQVMTLSEKTAKKDKTHNIERKQRLEIIDFDNQSSRMFSIPFTINPMSINVYFDGRMISALSYRKKNPYNIAVLSPYTEKVEVQFLKGHEKEARDCLCMGPKIISCGKESSHDHTVRIWGTEFYVRTQISKLSG
jgi:WD40 repeat protein